MQDILRVWHGDRCIRASTAQQYLQWIGRFRRYCRARGLEEGAELSRAGVKRFRAWYTRFRKINPVHLGLASSSLRSLRRVYEVMGLPVSPWQSIERRRRPATAVLRGYADYLGQHRGNPEITIRKKLDDVGKLLEHLRRSGKSWRRLSLPDIDAFLIECASRYARSTTAGIASTIRSFSRFLLASGRIRTNLADGVISPVQPRFERPQRALPWEDVRRLLRAVDTSTARGLRDHALLLMMSTYGLGAGEVIGLQLQDIDWDASTLQMSRPKTGVKFVSLPMCVSPHSRCVRSLFRCRDEHEDYRHRPGSRRNAVPGVQAGHGHGLPPCRVRAQRLRALRP
ncbi:MAG: tyrosine-type recombinase/integrase [Pseudomonadales bacterium]